MKAKGNNIFSTFLNLYCSYNRIRAYSLHPGGITTNLQASAGILGTVASIACNIVGKSIPQGAATSVYCAVSPEVDEHGGKYFVNCQVASSYHPSYTPEVAQKLWERSLEYCKIGQYGQP